MMDAPEKSGKGGVILGVWMCVVLLFLVLPLPVVGVMSLSSGKFLSFPPPSMSFYWYRETLGDPIWIGAAINSLEVALMAVVLALPCAVSLAVATYPLPDKVKRIISFLALGPLIIPVIVFSIALFFVFAKLGLIGTKLGIALGHAILIMPFTYMTVSTALEYFDDGLIEAAETLGATRLYAWRTILLPFILPAVVMGATLSFMASFDEAVVAIFIGQGSTLTLPSLIWRSLNVELTPAVAAVASMVTSTGLLLQGLAVLCLRSYFKSHGLKSQ